MEQGSQGLARDGRGAVVTTSKYGASTGSALGARLGLAGLALGLVGGVAAAHTPAVALGLLPQEATQATQATEKHVLSGSTGATLLNLPNDKGHDVLRVEGDTPLAVHPYREGVGYLKVTVPGGVKVWVFGKYLTESARPGWVEVTGSYVNMRPRPRSANSYPMGQLDRGDRLRFIQRRDPSKPMIEDWVQVWSPPDTKAYVLAAETRALPAGANAKKLWDEAVSSALNGQPNVPVPAAGKTGQQPSGAQSGKAGAAQADTPSAPGLFASLAEANAVMDRELQQEKPDYASVLAFYEAVLAMNPDAPTRRLIDERLERLELRRELDQIKAEVAAQDQARKAELARRQEIVDQQKRSHDPLWGRFQARGWLELQEKAGEKHYLVRWGSDVLARVQCSSGRYDLDLFDGVEIGVQGSAIRAAEATSGSYPLIDIDRIEVLSVRLRGR